MSVLLKTLSAALLAIVLAAPAAAAGGPYYLGAHGGGALLEDATITGKIAPVTLQFKPGGEAALAFGSHLGAGRIELEVGYRQHAIDGVVVGGKAFDPGGDFTAVSVMLNSYVDFPSRRNLTPYYTAGVGMADVRLHQDLSLSLTFAETDDRVFAYQGGAGVGWAVTSALTLDLGYRYFATLDPEFTTTDGRAVAAEYRTHNLLLGARLTF